jgi:hypothetical protein
MKKLISLLVVAMMISSAGFGQKIMTGKVPQNIRKAFSKEFPKATGAAWMMDEGNYEVNFTIDKVKNSAIFDKDGKWLEKEAVIKESDLPKSVKSALKRDFKGYKLSEAEKVETPDKGIEYHVGINTKAGEAFELVYSPAGEMLSQKAKESKPGTEVPQGKKK